MQAPPTPSSVRGCHVTPLLLGALAVAAALAACAAKKTPEVVRAAPAELSAATSSFNGSDNGMEMMWWGVTAGSRTLAELFSPYLADDVGLDARTRALWQSNGIRLVSVPIDRIDAIRSLSHQTGGIQRQWLGQVPVWTDIIHGSSWHDLQAVNMDNGRLTLGPGRLRVLLRCWTMPVPAFDVGGADTIRAVMRTELLLQHQEPGRIDPASLYVRPTDVSDPLHEGLVFNRLAASVSLPPDRALLVIPETPEMDWRSLAQIPPEQLAEEQALLAETRASPFSPLAPPEPPHNLDSPDEGATRVGQIFRERAAARARPAEPAAPEIPGPVDPTADFARTLGELLLIPSRARLGAGITDRPAVRSVLVLVPRIPQRFKIEPADPPPDPPTARTAPAASSVPADTPTGQ